MVAETQPPAHEEVAAPVEDVAEAEESVNAEPAKTYRPLFGASLEDLLSMLVGLAAGCFCLYLGLYSPMLSVTRMQKMKMPQDIQWDERNRRFFGWWGVCGTLLAAGGASILLSCLGLVYCLVSYAKCLMQSVKRVFSGAKVKTD